VTKAINDDLAWTIASLLMADPGLAPPWTASWKSRPKECLVHLADCLPDREDITERLHGIRCPALIVHGTADMAICAERTEALHGGLRHVDPMVWIEGASHASNLTHPQMVNPALHLCG
jgi:3-oxoadipate enol-lactonase